MFKTTALDSVANAYVDEVGVTPGTRLEADDRNIVQDELVNAVEASGQTLDPTGVKKSQEAIAMFLNGVGAQSMVDGGTANAKVLTPVTGASGYVFGETYTQLSGGVFLFKNIVLNTGAVTINVGQTAGTLIGIKSLTQPGGAALTGGELVAGEYILVIYDLANDRFELAALDTSAFAASGVNADITSMTNLDNDGIPPEKIADGIERAILGDATKGRVERRLNINILNGTNAATIKVNATGIGGSVGWNATSIAEEDNLGKPGDTGNFSLDASGAILTLDNTGLDGDMVYILSAQIHGNLSAVPILVGCLGSNLYFFNVDSGAAEDLTTLVNTGVISVQLVYLTAS